MICLVLPYFGRHQLSPAFPPSHWTPLCSFSLWPESPLLEYQHTPMYVSRGHEGNWKFQEMIIMITKLSTSTFIYHLLNIEINNFLKRITLVKVITSKSNRLIYHRLSTPANQVKHSSQSGFFLIILNLKLHYSR